MEKGALDMIVDRRAIEERARAIARAPDRPAGARVLSAPAVLERRGAVPSRHPSLGRAMTTTPMNRPATLAAWLAYLETLHPKAIALGLDRVAQVHARMHATLDCPVVTVTGTNGKGSTCAMLESVLRSAGYRTGLYTSPHLLRYNERVRIGGEPQDDAAIVEAFNAVEDARGDVPLTYFEYGTLAAFHAFSRATLDVVILEVGLGGRLDAVNIVDADVAVVTTIDLDHMDYLGPTRADIAYEKAGIFRAGRPVVCAEPDPPSTMTRARRSDRRAVPADRPRLRLRRRGRTVAILGSGRRSLRPCLVPALRGAYQLANAATALAVVGLAAGSAARGRGRDSRGSLRGESRRAASRCFRVGPRSSSTLRTIRTPRACSRPRSERWDIFRETIAVFGMLADKDIGGVIAAVGARIDRWFVATVPGPRGASADVRMRAELVRAGIASVRRFARSPTSRRRSRRRAKQRTKLIELSFSDRSSRWRRRWPRRLEVRASHHG